ncbi:MAG: tryptophan--tRNA ligase [Geminicoccaceae bacterium]|nr:tryptophan--tRNA ligase [Geminicoccaceae bacterium]
MTGRIFSGIQPTHGIQLGNYLGAIRNWVKLQQDYECIYCLVDLHALTTVHDKDAMTRNTREVAAALLACGVDPKRSILFAQSNVAAHAQLAWVLNCVAPIGWLNRMTQFKEKAGKNREKAPVGLFVYPVLMAADILAYKATHVPVGEDQKQHLELARDIAGSFNNRFAEGFFPLPEPLILGEATRVMSLRDGRAKMSKSDPSDMSRINLTDDAESIVAKIKKAKSDAIVGITYDPENRPEASNLLTIYAALAERSRADVARQFADTPFSTFKAELADLMVDKLAPITAEMRRLMDDPGHIDAVLREGAARADAIAAPVLEEVYAEVGFLRP